MAHDKWYRTYGKEARGDVDDLLFSADSHVIEPPDLWQERLPQKLRERAPVFRRERSSGGTDKAERVNEMSADGVSGEVLYPTDGLKVLSVDDSDLEEACVRVYNDWIIDYCSAAPDRLVGNAMLSLYDMNNAVREMERTRKAGLRGAVVWQVPPPDLPFTSDHYEPLWAAAQDLEMPVSLHILSGHGYIKDIAVNGQTEQERNRNTVNRKLSLAMDSLQDIIFSGVLDRFPRLKLVMVENEIGWIPFVLEQWDFYHAGKHGDAKRSLPLLPSEYFHRQVFATFFNDAVGAHLLSWWGVDNCMWSSDFPHNNTTWPRSRQVVARDLGDLPAASRAKLVRENVAQLYQIPLPSPIKISAVSSAS